MDDDLYERYAKSAADAAGDAAGRAAFVKGLELGIEIGEQRGMAAGVIVGYRQGKLEGILETREAYKSAISDGTKHGSPVCARELEAYKRPVESDDED